MITYSEEQLCSFGNYLLKRYGVYEHSTDGKNTPLHQREVHDADVCNWKDENPNKEDHLPLPSRYKIGDKAKFFCMPDDPNYTQFPGIPCEILAIHFYAGKVKYDLDLLFVDNQRSRIYNIDSILVGDWSETDFPERLAYRK